MNQRKSCESPALRARSGSLLQGRRRWWRSQDPSERYLAESTDHADLERRMRILEHASVGPPFVTFNH